MQDEFIPEPNKEAAERETTDGGLFYVEKGEGFPLVLLHGNGESHEYFVHQIAYFSKQYRVFALDTRGHGQSPRGDGPFSIARFAEDLHDFFIEHSLSKAHVLGFSDGANSALAFALRWPERVETLILNGGNLSPEGVRRRTQWPIELGYRLVGHWADKSPQARAHAELLGLMVKEPHVRPEELQALPMPTLVIAGTNDMIRRRHTEQIARSIPDARLCLVPGGHFIANKKPAEFNRAVEKFLQEKGGKQ